MMRSKSSTKRRTQSPHAKMVRARPTSQVLLEMHRTLGALFYALGRREGFPVAAFERDFLRALERLGMAGTPAAKFMNELRAGERDRTS